VPLEGLRVAAFEAGAAEVAVAGQMVEPGRIGAQPPQLPGVRRPAGKVGQQVAHGTANKPPAGQRGAAGDAVGEHHQPCRTGEPPEAVQRAVQVGQVVQGVDAEDQVEAVRVAEPHQVGVAVGDVRARAAGHRQPDHLG
jgi:hypothetical protein